MFKLKPGRAHLFEFLPKGDNPPKYTGEFVAEHDIKAGDEIRLAFWHDGNCKDGREYLEGTVGQYSKK